MASSSSSASTSASVVASDKPASSKGKFTAVNGASTTVNGSDSKGKSAEVATEEQRQPFDDSDIDRILAQEATGVQRDEEVCCLIPSILEPEARQLTRFRR